MIKFLPFILLAVAVLSLDIAVMLMAITVRRLGKLTAEVAGTAADFMQSQIELNELHDSHTKGIDLLMTNLDDYTELSEAQDV